MCVSGEAGQWQIHSYDEAEELTVIIVDINSYTVDIIGAR